MQFKLGAVRLTVLGGMWALVAGSTLVAGTAAATESVDADASIVAVSDVGELNEALDAKNVDHGAQHDIDDGAKNHMDDGAKDDVNHEAQNDGAFENDVKSSTADAHEAQQDATEAQQEGQHGGENGTHGGTNGDHG